MTTIDDAIDKGYLVLERISPDRFEKTKKLRLKYMDKNLISFTDLTSVVVMIEKEIETILTEDDHFSYLEYGFQQTQLDENKVHK